MGERVESAVCPHVAPHALLVRYLGRAAPTITSRSMYNMAPAAAFYSKLKNFSYIPILTNTACDYRRFGSTLSIDSVHETSKNLF
jgi:hypothetical protein